MGFGQDGGVWATNRGAALKAFERQANDRTELACYERLAAEGIKAIEGFSLPSLLGWDDDLLVIEMSIVTPPYLLDFGKAYLDRPFDFEEGGFTDWELEKRELYDTAQQWEIVSTVLARLASLGIHYYDAKPANIRFAE
ncbi:hypothetical protein Mal64_27420 [Pseudobythopirellula maris]|uniref:Protein kinase domain-containing protein n=1 Tax=Pseudobythopirellula maris TaxID=2527991 RepID=A0A5C5ZIL7_9BACT|nr:hypothetical protein Mal64_27420 [Pseudobythopirellula maris]